MSSRAMLATVERLPAPPPSRAALRRRVAPGLTLGWGLYFVAWTAAFMALALWLLSRHYVNDGALWGWSTVIASLDAGHFASNRPCCVFSQ